MEAYESRVEEEEIIEESDKLINKGKKLVDENDNNVAKNHGKKDIEMGVSLKRTGESRVEGFEKK